MKFQTQIELPQLTVVAIPFLYLSYIYPELPDVVPLHWDFQGNPDRMGSKLELIVIPILLPLLTYLIFLFLPIVKSSEQIAASEKKITKLRFFTVLLMSILALMVLSTVKNGTINSPNHVFIIIGLLYSLLGNYMPSLNPNYFIGIRIPSTLKNKNNWIKTHQLAGRLWFGAGVLIVLLNFKYNGMINIITFLFITFFISIVPIVYSLRTRKSA